jgi:hypothetical protein
LANVGKRLRRLIKSFYAGGGARGVQRGSGVAIVGDSLGRLNFLDRRAASRVVATTQAHKKDKVGPHEGTRSTSLR